MSRLISNPEEARANQPKTQETEPIDITQKYIDFLNNLDENMNPNNSNWGIYVNDKFKEIRGKTLSNKSQIKNPLRNLQIEQGTINPREYVSVQTVQNNLRKFLKDKSIGIEGVKQSLINYMQGEVVERKQMTSTDRRNKKDVLDELRSLEIDKLSVYQIVDKLKTRQFNGLANIINNIEALEKQNIPFNSKELEIINKAKEAVRLGGIQPEEDEEPEKEALAEEDDEDAEIEAELALLDEAVVEAELALLDEEGRQQQPQASASGKPRATERRSSLPIDTQPTGPTPEIAPKQIREKSKQKKQKKKKIKKEPVREPQPDPEVEQRIGASNILQNVGTITDLKRGLVAMMTGDHVYTGSGTPLVEFLQAGQKPVSVLDTIAMEHDIRYTTATKDEEVNEADAIFIKRLVGELKRNPFNGSRAVEAFATALMAAKTALDRLPGSKTERWYVDYKKNKALPENIKNTLLDIQNKLEEKEILTEDNIAFIFTKEIQNNLIYGLQGKEEEESDEEAIDSLEDQLNRMKKMFKGRTKDDIERSLKSFENDPNLMDAVAEYRRKYMKGRTDEPHKEPEVLQPSKTAPRGALEQTPLSSLPTFTPTLAGDPVSLPSRAGPTSQTTAPKKTLRGSVYHPTMNAKERARQNMIQREQYLFQADEEGQNVAPPVPNTYARPGFPTQWLDIEKFKNYQTAEYKKEQDEIWIRNNQTPFQYGAGTVDNSVKDIKNVSERLAAIEDYIRYELATKQFPEDESRTGYYFGQPQKRLGRIPTSHHERWDAYVKMNKDMSKYTHTQRVNEPTRNKLINRNVNYELTQIKPGQQVLYDELELEEPHKFDIKNNKDLQYYIRKYRKR